jgi:hypothetical protein
MAGTRDIVKFDKKLFERRECDTRLSFWAAFTKSLLFPNGVGRADEYRAEIKRNIPRLSQMSFGTFEPPAILEPKAYRPYFKMLEDSFDCIFTVNKVVAVAQKRAMIAKTTLEYMSEYKEAERDAGACVYITLLWNPESRMYASYVDREDCLDNGKQFFFYIKLL